MKAKKAHMNFYEEDLYYEISKPQEKGLFDNDLITATPEPEMLGIKVRLGNEPIIRNLKTLMELSNKQLPPEIEILFKTNDIYTVTHAIGIMRVKGNAKVKELQYNAEITDLKGSTTIDLLPNTSFKTLLALNSNLEGVVKAGGNFSAKVPEELNQTLSGKAISLGGDLELHLSTNTQFVGKLNYSVKLPVVASSGIATNKCTWILNPDASPLLGDQLLVQTVAVPKGAKNIQYKIKGVVKIDKGFFQAPKEMETSTQTIKSNLNI